MKNILIFGDSNSWGYDYTTYDPQLGIAKRMAFAERWPGRLQTLLGAGYRIIENCLNARTNVMADPYFPNRVGLTSFQIALDANAPLDMVVIQLGCNELKHMFNLTAGMIVLGVEKLVLEAKKSYYGYPVPQILVIAPHPTHPKISEMIYGFSFGAEAYKKSLEFSRLYEEMSIRQGVDFLDCAPLRFELNALDGLHYSTDDHRKLAEAAQRKIQSMTEQSAADVIGTAG